jgi:hypothetical protein
VRPAIIALRRSGAKLGREPVSQLPLQVSGAVDARSEAVKGLPMVKTARYRLQGGWSKWPVYILLSLSSFSKSMGGRYSS